MDSIVKYYEDSLNCDIEVKKNIYDFPDKINRNSQFFKSAQHNQQLLDKYSSASNYELMYIRDRKIKYLDNMFYTEAFPTNPQKSNDESLYCFIGFREMFSDDYDSLQYTSL